MESPATIGPYRVLRLIDAGGMGEVYHALQLEPFEREVALKLIRQDRATSDRIARFRDEIQALASLSHNGIARLFEAGTAEGRPYFAMEYVPGTSITDYCSEQQLDLPARLRLFLDVCRAVEHAHRQGIVHRDLKPSNILVFGPAGEPVVKVIDFGLARLLDRDRATARTRTSQILGTLDYMSPEQASEQREHDIDERADVYALGAVLYELLTGMQPLALRRLHPDEAIQALRERAPSSPSLRVLESSSGSEEWARRCRLGSYRRLSRRLEGDLDCIVLMALAKDPDRRYRTVGQLGEDVGRFLRCEPVRARKPTLRYLGATFLRRHRGRVAVAATALLLLAATGLAIDRFAKDRARSDERTELFALARRLVQLLDADIGDPPPARPEHLPRLRQWLRDVEAVRAQADRIQAYLRELARQGAAADPLRPELERTLQQLESMAQPGDYLDTFRRRIQWAETVVAATVERHRDAWQRVRRELLEDARFRFALEPQVGLVPLGADPDTGLQEFALPLPDTELPQRRGGRLVIGPWTCPVFVLLPGGRVDVGAQDHDPQGFRYDHWREAFESELQQVEIQPFFAAKFEFSNGQWAAVDPVGTRDDPTHPLRIVNHPVVGLTGAAMLQATQAYGMRLPTGDEWEYLARGNSDTPWWCGDDPACLQGRENLCDAGTPKCEGNGVPWDDGYPFTAPIDSLRPNGFGLHHTLGNACEAAIDDQTEEGLFLEVRASSWHMGPYAARVTARFSWDGSDRPSIGFRPVISVQR